MAEIESRVRDIIVNELGVEPSKVTPEASFVEDLGADSLDTVELVMAFEEEFGIEIPDEDAEKMETVGDAPPEAVADIARPTRGMRMDQVLQTYGEPMQRLSAVGEPPISRWIYDGYTVYFEHEYTITSVLRHRGATPSP